MAGENKRLMPRHFRICDLAVSGEFTNAQIAQIVGMSAVGVGLILSSAPAQEYMARRREEIAKGLNEEYVENVSLARKTLEQGSLEAAELLVGQVEDPMLDPRVRQSSAKAILDKVFAQDNSSRGGVTVLAADQMQVLAIALRESREMRGQTVGV